LSTEELGFMAKAMLASYIAALGLTDTLKNFEFDFTRRLQLQKIVYLLQEAGAELGYHFGWYIHGPYSSSLANDAYPLSSAPAEIIDTFKSPVDEKAAKKFRSLIDSVPSDKRRADVLELLASVHYVMTHSFPRARTRKEAISSILDLKRGRFSSSEIGKAYDLLESKSFLK